jgi:hypothetical protein
MDAVWIEEPCWACGAAAGEPCRTGHANVVAALYRLDVVADGLVA